MAAFCEDDLDVHDPVEVHWSARTVLAVFFAASLISAVFFGLGYSFGGAGASNHSGAIAGADTGNSSTGPVVPQAPSTQAAGFNEPAVVANVAGDSSAHAPESAPSKLPAQVFPAAAPRMTHPTDRLADKHPAPPTAVVREEPTAGGSHIMIQVGAIGDRKDAERLVAELRKKGFHAGIYSEKRDKFLHVQIGPFKDAQQAKSKRHQVMASGFHAILKRTS